MGCKSFLLSLGVMVFGFYSGTAQAYPEFVGYGYSACMTCHYNGLGGGPLNDYGRALLAGEISSRLFFSKSTTDDDIAAESGFLGKTELPKWLRPHINYRGMQMRMNPGGGANDTSQFYQMQEDIGVTVPFDSKGKYLASVTWGHVSRPEDYGHSKEGLGQRIVAEEYFFRYEPVKKTWIYAGLMEKAYGLRNVDHSSYQRTYQGFGQTPSTPKNPNNPNGMDRAQGLIVNTATESWDISGNYFIGNPYNDPDFQEKGFSAVTEYQLAEKKKLGASVLSQASNVLTKQMAAIHYRQGLTLGSSILAEYGVIQDKTPGSNATSGSYDLIEGFMYLSRGYNFRVIVERYNKEFKSDIPDQWRWTLGLLMFPFPRFEVQTNLINQRAFEDSAAGPDSWIFQGQLHVSL